jgi:hypothetical protein
VSRKLSIVILVALLASFACEGETGSPGPGGQEPSTPTELNRKDDAPLVTVTVERVLGASDSFFRPVDRISVQFTLTDARGKAATPATRI